MKIWIKLLIAMILGALIGIFVPDFIYKFDNTNLINNISNLTIRLLLYLTSVYILVKCYIGFINILKLKNIKRLFKLLCFIIFLSVLFSILISIIFMNFSIFQPAVNFTQQSDIIINPVSIKTLFFNIINNNIISSIAGQTKYLLPIIFISIIFAIASYVSGKKGVYFIDTIESFDDILDKIIRQILEYFSIGAIFIFATFINSEIFNYNNFIFIIKPFTTIIIISFIILITYSIILYIFIKNKLINFYFGFLGAGLISFLTGNTASTIIPVNEFLKNNIGVKKEISDSLTPITVILNKTGTIIVSSVVLFSLIYLYTPDILSLKLQITFFILIFIFSLFLDGANEKGFLILVITILNIKFLHLEQDSYLLFLVSIPLFSRIAIFIDSFTTAVFITIIAKITDSLEDRKYLEYI